MSTLLCRCPSLACTPILTFEDGAKLLEAAAGGRVGCSAPAPLLAKEGSSRIPCWAIPRSAPPNPRGSSPQGPAQLSAGQGSASRPEQYVDWPIRWRGTINANLKRCDNPEVKGPLLENCIFAAIEQVMLDPV